MHFVRVCTTGGCVVIAEILRPWLCRRRKAHCTRRIKREVSQRCGGLESVRLASPGRGQIDGCIIWILPLDLTKLIKGVLNLARWRLVNMIWNVEYLLFLFTGLDQEARPCPFECEWTVQSELVWVSGLVQSDVHRSASWFPVEQIDSCLNHNLCGQISICHVWAGHVACLKEAVLSGWMCNTLRLSGLIHFNKSLLMLQPWGKVG